jgi:RHS repeat-associated protein
MEIVGGQDKNTHSTKRRLSGAPDTKLYWYDGARQVLTETDSRGNAVDNYVYFNGVSIAKLHIEPGPTYYSYYVRDHLGTTRMITDQAGNVCYDADYFPWGGEQHVYANGCPQNYKFSGKERDPDMGSDYFGARFYQGAMARFYSPDWSATVEPVPYAKLDNPQSLNLYIYVVNNPLRYTDADGHDMEGSGGSDSISGTADSGQGAPGGPAQNHSQTQTQQNQQSPQRGLTVGVGVAGNADVGGVKAGAETNATVVATASISSSGKPSVGLVASGAAVTYAGDHVAAAPKQETKPLVAGAYAGGGVTFVVANTANAKGLSGPFQTISGNVGGGQGASVALSFDHNGTFVFQVTFGGPGLGVSGWAVTTNTKAGCAGCE